MDMTMITGISTTPTRNSTHTGNTVRGTTGAIILKSYLGPRDSNSRSDSRSRIWSRRRRMRTRKRSKIRKSHNAIGGTTSATRKLRISTLGLVTRSNSTQILHGINP